MRTQSFNTVSNVLLVLICLCISVFQNTEVNTILKEENVIKKASFDAGADVLNPIYIFK